MSSTSIINYSYGTHTRVRFTLEHLIIDTMYHQDCRHNCVQGLVEIPWSNVAFFAKSTSKLANNVIKVVFAPNLRSHASNRVVLYDGDRIYLALDYERFVRDLQRSRLIVPQNYGWLKTKVKYFPRSIDWFVDRGLVVRNRESSHTRTGYPIEVMAKNDAPLDDAMYNLLRLQ